jgi:transcription antitermination factor NusG
VRRQLTYKQLDTFLPRVARWSQWKDRRKRIEWPLFPGYCFVRFDGVDTLPILDCAGVLSIVSFDGKPAPIAPDEIDNLRRLEAAMMSYDACPFIREGAVVEVVGGPLRGITGRLLRKDARRATVLLSVTLISQAVKVEVDAADIRAR